MTTSEVNPGLEVLIEHRAVRPGPQESMVRAAIINCLGCKTAKSDPEKAAIYANEIKTCGGVSQSAVTIMLRRLEKAGVLTSDGDYKHYGRPHYYEIADTEVGRAFEEAVGPPEVCPLEAAQRE